jgi:hypothetical protein
MTMPRLLFAAAAAVLVCVSAGADDTKAALAAGGIAFADAVPVRAVSEDLHIGTKNIQDRWVFVNDSGVAAETQVLFRLPDLDVGRFFFERIGTVGKDPANFVDFSAGVNGRKVKPDILQRAFVGDKDVTDLIAAAGAPLDPVIGKGYFNLDAIPSAERKKLIDAGAVAVDSFGNLQPKWQVRTTLSWAQKFPPRRKVTISVSYRPVTGGAWIPGDAFDPAAADGPVETYCLDEAALAAARARMAVRQHDKAVVFDALYGRFTDYRLANPATGPIGRFHLTVDKPDAKSVLSMCWDGALKKTGPKRLETTAMDFAPTRDIRLLMLQ